MLSWTIRGHGQYAGEFRHLEQNDSTDLLGQFYCTKKRNAVPSYQYEITITVSPQSPLWRKHVFKHNDTILVSLLCLEMYITYDIM